jgi:RHS repeat-associated protein
MTVPGGKAVREEGSTLSFPAIASLSPTAGASKTAVQQGDSGPVTALSQYSYDSIYELTQAVVNGGVAESYSYDAVGNRLTSAGPTSYNYNTSNQLTSDSTATFTYDNNGNTTSKTTLAGTTNYSWDFENRLSTVTLPGTGGAVNFRYDPFGRRVFKSSSAGTSVFVYDGANTVEELNGLGNNTAHYAQGVGIDEPLAMYRSSATSYYHADGLGSIGSLTDASGQLAASYVYDSFGKLTASTGTITNPFQYTARESDSESGLYYYRARYYDPNSGRFLSEDPIRFKGGINFCRYAANDPVIFRDPSGLLVACF